MSPLVTATSSRPSCPLAITAFTATTAVGAGVAALTAALRAGRGGLVANDHTQEPLPTFIGRVAAIEEVALPPDWRHLDCRNNRLAWLGLQQDRFVDAVDRATERWGAARVAVLIGTSTSTIAASENAYRGFATGDVSNDLGRDDLHHLHATTAFVRDVLRIDGPAMTVSTACSSSAKVFAQATRMIAAGLVDAAVVGGVDSLAASTLFGFHALGLVSQRPCRPFDARRDGISIGEAAGFALVERFADDRHAGNPLLVGYGESSDAHHMSSPHPDGLGGRIAIEAALERGGVCAEVVDYINLHGTATAKNDAVEAALVGALFTGRVRASSTKAFTGHTLGAAGIVEAAVCLVALREAFAPATLGCDERDADCGPQIRIERTDGPVDIALSNAFAFGGNNCVLAFARDAGAWRRAQRP